MHYAFPSREGARCLCHFEEFQMNISLKYIGRFCIILCHSLSGSSKRASVLLNRNGIYDRCGAKTET